VSLDYYDRFGKPLPDFVVFGRLFHDPAYQTVRKARVGGIRISTVWLGLDHSFGQGPPLIFETMVFGDRMDEEYFRYATEAEAIEGHYRMARRVRGWRFWQRIEDTTEAEIAHQRAFRERERTA